MYLLGYDIGSSSVKASLVEVATGKCTASAFFPPQEAPIASAQPGWAEQDPDAWWAYLKQATAAVLAESRVVPDDIKAIGISYQMHGLVCVDRAGKPLRPSIIWCDSRAVPYGQRAFRKLGTSWCLSHLLNSPGNFTAAKLAWVKDKEPAVYEKIWKIMLPGDYIALRLTGTAATTVSGLSEGIFWDFAENAPSQRLLDAMGLDADMLAPVVPTFGDQGRLSAEAARELGLAAGTPVTYRAGDQPNNALSLNVLNPGEIASTAGTSGVVYGVIGQVAHDPLSRVNPFAHVNHSAENPRLGVLLCINGTGILNAWVRRTLMPEGLSYAAMNDLAAQVPVGSDGIAILPFGNGAERMLENRDAGCSFHGVNFNRHGRAHLLRAAQEGIVFSFQYGIEIMEEMGLRVNKIHAGRANMFLSPIFRETLAGVSGATIELYDTDGSVGAARGAGIGAGIYSSAAEAFSTLERLAVVEPSGRDEYCDAYERWKSYLKS
jgi:xylulokinase